MYLTFTRLPESRKVLRAFGYRVKKLVGETQRRFSFETKQEARLKKTTTRSRISLFRGKQWEIFGRGENAFFAETKLKFGYFFQFWKNNLKFH